MYVHSESFGVDSTLEMNAQASKNNTNELHVSGCRKQ